MGKGATVTRKHPGVGPNIVRAWFDTVINPLLFRLGEEREWLAAKNWTWRFRPGALEAMRPVAANVESGPNLKHFLKLNPKLEQSVRRHDEGVLLLSQKCKLLHQEICAYEAFRALFHRASTPQSLSNLGYEDAAQVFGAYSREEHMALVAQYIVNRNGEQPPHYTTARFWNRHKDEFLAILDHPAVKPRCLEADRAGSSLLRRVDQLSPLLEETRLRLSLKHDVPPDAVISRPAVTLERNF